MAMRADGSGIGEGAGVPAWRGLGLGGEAEMLLSVRMLMGDCRNTFSRPTGYEAETGGRAVGFWSRVEVAETMGRGDWIEADGLSFGEREPGESMPAVHRSRAFLLVGTLSEGEGL